MMGGGTPNHVADLKYYGVWNPQSPTSYLIHDTTSRLRHLGVGCEMKIKDTTTVAYFVSQLKDLVQKVQSGDYPANGFYLQSIFFEQGDLNNMLFYNKVLQIADSTNAIVTSGSAQWKTFKQAYTIWETSFNAQMFQWECGAILSGGSETKRDEMSLYPNPSTGIVTLKTGTNSNANVVITDVFGKIIFDRKLSGQTNEINLSDFSAGIYFVKVTTAAFTTKLVLSRN